MKRINWGTVEEAKEFERLGSGGYVCKIVSITDNPQKEYLKVVMDVAEGGFKNFGANAEKRNENDWSYIRMFRSYKEKALGMFKAFLSALEKSNPNFKADTFDGDENKLIGLLIGIVLGFEEYVKNDGTVGVRTYVKTVTTVEKIRTKDFKVPDLKKLPADTQASENVTSAPAAYEDEDLPF